MVDSFFLIQQLKCWNGNDVPTQCSRSLLYIGSHQPEDESAGLLVLSSLTEGKGELQRQPVDRSTKGVQRESKVTL